MRAWNLSHKEATFKASKKSRKWKSGNYSSDESDIEMAHLVRKLKRKSKFEGRLPRICFNCGKIRHFTTKFPYSGSQKAQN